MSGPVNRVGSHAHRVFVSLTSVGWHAMAAVTLFLGMWKRPSSTASERVGQEGVRARGNVGGSDHQRQGMVYYYTVFLI